MKFKIELLRKYEEEGWIYSQVHPTLPLIVWNYSNLTQYEGYWDEITLNCRALVTDVNGTVVSKGFSKFFNYSEGKTDIPENIEYIRVFEKLDGSYIGLFYYNNQWIVHSKGSFTSDQSKWAESILKERDLSFLNKTWTYCFELIVPENRIVVDYGDKKDLVFLRAFHTETGKEIEVNNLQGFVSVNSWLEVNFNPKKLQELNLQNKEGFVIKFSNGERCKIKFKEYLRLHKIITNTTSYDIWECLRDGQDFNEILDKVPDEFYDWVKQTKEELESLYFFWESSIKAEYNLIKNIEDNKEFAERVKHNKFKSFLFSLKNNRSIDQQIWKNIKPEYKKAFQI